MKRFASACLCLVLICFGFLSCGKRIEMEESKTYHFKDYDLSFAVPKDWKVEQATGDFENGPVETLFIRGLTYKDESKYDITSFYVCRPNDTANIPHFPDFDEKICKKYGNNYIYIPSVDTSIIPNRCGLYIDKFSIFAIVFNDFPRREITPGLEAIFNSFKIEKTKTDSSNKDI
ncbi:MAG: hypothetical protein HGA95_03985 [Caldiserica bacterium]|nr:hypothetical protein [Caldisericota bacterium]